MKKIALLLGGILVALLLILPGLLGGWVERELNARLQSPELHGGHLAVTASRVERGWFSSRVVLELAFPSAPNAAGDVSPAALQLVSVVRHGPFGVHQGLFFGLFRAVTVPGPDNPQIQELVAMLDLPYLFQVVLTARFNGSQNFECVVPPVSADGSDLGEPVAAGSVQFSGLKLLGEVSGQVYEEALGKAPGAAERWSLHGGFDALKIVGDEAEFRLNGVSVAVAARALGANLWLGPATLELQSLDLGSKGQASSIAAEALMLAFSTSTQSSAKTSDLGLTARARKLIGAGVEFTDAQVTLLLEAVSVSALEDFAATADGPALLHRLLSESLVATFKPIAFTLQGDALAGKLQLRANGARVPSATAMGWRDIALWSTLLSIEGAVQVAAPLAEKMTGALLQTQLALGSEQALDVPQTEALSRAQVPLRLAGLVAQGVLRPSADGYAAELVYDDGALQVNGRTVPLKSLLQ